MTSGSRNLALTLALGSVCASACALAESSRLASGYITAVDPAGNFDVEGLHIRLTPSTAFETPKDPQKASQPTVPTAKPSSFFLGETLDVYGPLDRKTATITASRVVLIPIAPAEVNGTAIIDLVPPASSSARIVRADGYLLQIAAATKLTSEPPLTPGSDLTTNLWITYRGVQQADGTVLLSTATVSKNEVKHTEDKLRKKNEYDPAAVDPSSNQSGVSKFFLGLDIRKVPPWPDENMQARVQRIGVSLIPAFQRDLPATEPTKINFRFGVIGPRKVRDALTLPNGIIVVPHDVVERLPNDSQLAEVLADNIAEALEKEGLRSLGAQHLRDAGDITSNTLMFLSPAGLAAGLVANRVAAHMLEKTLQQSGRVSLCLLHDAGYDLAEAPIAWWLLAPKKPQPIEKTAMPARAANLYMTLGATWHPAPSPRP